MLKKHFHYTTILKIIISTKKMLFYYKTITEKIKKDFMTCFSMKLIKTTGTLMFLKLIT